LQYRRKEQLAISIKLQLSKDYNYIVAHLVIYIKNHDLVYCNTSGFGS